MILEEYKYDFAKLLHKKLKEKIRAGIEVRFVNGEELSVKIIRDREIDYSWTINEFSDKFFNGLDTDIIVYEIVAGYKKRVFAKHFY